MLNVCTTADEIRDSIGTNTLDFVFKHLPKTRDLDKSGTNVSSALFIIIFPKYVNAQEEMKTLSPEWVDSWSLDMSPVTKRKQDKFKVGCSGGGGGSFISPSKQKQTSTWALRWTVIPAAVPDRFNFTSSFLNYFHSCTSTSDSWPTTRVQIHVVCMAGILNLFSTKS